MSKTKVNFQKSIFLWLALLLVLPMLLCLNNNVAFAQEPGDPINYIQVSSLEDLKQKIDEGTQDFEITEEISISEETTFTGLNFKYNPETAKCMFNISKDASLKLENCKVLGQSNWTTDTSDPANVKIVAEEETAGKQTFIKGSGNLTLQGCEFKDIYVKGNFIAITGAEGALLDLNVYACNFEHCAVEGVFVYSSYANQNWGNEEKTFAENTLHNFYGNNNGSFIQAHHEDVNLRQLNIKDVVHVRNGLIAIENTSNVNIYDGFYMENARGFYVPGGNFGSLIHLWSGCTFNMYGGTIKNCSGHLGIICTGTENLTFNFYGGEILCKGGDTFLVIENATVTFYQDALCEGNVNCWASGTLNNHGTIRGKITISEDTVYSTEGEPVVNNDGTIEGSIEMSLGTLKNEGNIYGNVSVTGGEFTNGAQGSITGYVFASGDGTMVNNGTIVGQTTSEVAGDGTIAEPSTLLNTEPSTSLSTWAIVCMIVEGVAVLGLIAGLVFVVMKKKKNKAM